MEVKRGWDAGSSRMEWGTGVRPEHAWPMGESLGVSPPPMLKDLHHQPHSMRDGRRLIKPEEHPVLWDELPTPLGVVV